MCQLVILKDMLSVATTNGLRMRLSANKSTWLTLSSKIVLLHQMVICMTSVWSLMIHHLQVRLCGSLLEARVDLSSSKLASISKLHYTLRKRRKMLKSLRQTSPAQQTPQMKRQKTIDQAKLNLMTIKMRLT